MKQTPVVCHMASHMALVMSSITSVNASSVRIVNKIRKKRPLAAYFDENNAQLKQ